MLRKRSLENKLLQAAPFPWREMTQWSSGARHSELSRADQFSLRALYVKKGEELLARIGEKTGLLMEKYKRETK
jgi:hypothetical protein